MADILSLVFEHYSSHPKDTDIQLSSLPNCKPCVLVGGCSKIKTSVMFLAAVTAASELGSKVLYLTLTPIQSLPGPLQDTLANLSPENLKKIKFKYPRSVEEVLQEVASLHEVASGAAPLPSLIIVDGWERYLGLGLPGGKRQEPSVTAHFAALLLDTAAFLTRVLQERGENPTLCQVILSFDCEREGRTSGESSSPDPVLSVLDRYFSVRCTLDRVQSSTLTDAAGEPEGMWQIYFSGVGITAAHSSSNPECSGLGPSWQLAVLQNGAMEFSVPHAQSFAGK